VMNGEDLGYKGRLQVFSKRKSSFTKEMGDIYRLNLRFQRYQFR
jgi:hypothetical protein